MRASTAKQRVKTVYCYVCGTPLQVGSNTRKPKRCLECGIKALADNNRALHEHSGDSYEKWRNAMVEFITRGR